MVLPNQTELLNIFSSFLFEAGLSSVSIKNYLSDLRHFLNFCTTYSSSNSLVSNSATVDEVFTNLGSYIAPYIDHQKATFTPQTTTNRRLASIRRFTTFLSLKFSFPNIFTQQTISEQNTKNSNFRESFDLPESNQKVSPPILPSDSKNSNLPAATTVLSSAKILEQFKASLEREKKTHSTVKNYLSDLNHFFLWTANQTPYTTQNLLNILSETQLLAYVTYLKLSHTSTSVINRRQSSIKKLAKFCASEKYIPNNPFEFVPVSQKLAPLAWIERLASKHKKLSNGPKNRFAILYDKYHAISWAPYLNMALLVLFTTAMGIFAYNQIINQARLSSAATALTPPRRQLSFQGRLTDSSSTPITTAVNVVFKLFDNLTGPTELYTTGTCSITPDQDGIFNSLIGDGVCGSEIPASVFTDNRDVYLEIGVGAETLTPRQQIATVGYALNSETLQGYPASAAATINTVPVVDNSGNINIAVSSPSIISSSGVFTIMGQSLALKTDINSGGDIILQPDALGSGQILALGGTTTEDTFRITNSNLTTGALISGYVGNDLGTGHLLYLTSGASESARFWVATDGRTSINTATTSANMSALTINQGNTGNLISASTSGVARFTVTNSGNVDITGQYLVNGSPLSTSNWQRTSGSLAPLNITDSINIGSTATSSALVHLAGTAGENSFVNTGNLGVGLTNPSEKLDVNGNIKGGNLVLGQGSTATISTNDSGESLFISPSTTGDILLVSGVSSGNVGIGITNPSQKLDVVGNLQFSGALMPAGAAGSSGQFLVSAGAGVAPTWTSAVPASSVAFSGITSGTNTTAAMVVDTGASLNYANSGTINASSLQGGTWAIPGTIGSSTPNTGAFTTLTATTMNITGALQDNGNAGTSGQILASTGTGIDWINASTINFWQKTAGSVAPLDITDALNIGNSATASAYVHFAGTAGDDSFINNGFFGIGTTTPGFTLDVDGDINLTGALYDNGSAGLSGQVLSSTGTGVEWIDPPATGTQSPWDWSAGVIYPFSITDAVNLGNAATSSATVHLAGTAGDNSFINTGFFGVGLTNPAYTLDVNGNINLSGGIRASGSFGTSGQILSSTGTNAQWIDISAVSSNFWQEILGVLSPVNNTDSLSIGGTSTASAKFYADGVTGDASMSGNLTIGQGKQIRTQYGPLSLAYKSAPNTWTTGITLQDTTGNVGIGTTTPTSTLDVTGTAHITSTVTLDSLTANRIVVTDSAKNLVSSISSANLGLSITDETGTGLAVFNDSPTFANNITTPTVIGGVAGGSSLSLQSTSGTGTTDFINFKVGNAGATEAMRIINSGNVGIGDTTPASLFTVGTGDAFQVNSSGAIAAATGITSSGTITFTSLGTGIVHSTSGVLSASAIDLASVDVTGILPIANGGTNNNGIVSPYVSGKFIAYDGTRFVSTAFDSSSFEGALTFSNGLTRVGNEVKLGGTLTQTTTIDQDGFDMIFNGAGNFGIGVASPSAKFDVAGMFVVDSVTGRVGIGTTTPTVALDIAGTTSTISNSSGDITFNSASGFFNFSGDSLTNILDATISGQLTLGNYPTAGLPAIGNGPGTMVYDASSASPKYWDGSAWRNIGSFFDRTASGIIYPSNANDSLHIGGTPSASASALIRLSSNTSFNTFFKNAVAIGFTTAITPSASVALQVNGDILPQTTSTDSLGRTSYSYNNLFLETGINNTAGTQKISILNTRLTGGTPWAIVDGARIGDTSNTLPGGVKLYVSGAATVSGTFGVVGNTSLIGDVTVGGGTGKIDVGTVDPPYTINGVKYATFMTGMIGVKEEVMGKVATTQYIPGLGYRALIDLDGQETGSDLWLFGKTTNVKNNLDRLAVLLTAQGQAKTWYDIDETNKILAIYSTTSTDVIYRLTAPRFDDAKWTNTRTSEAVGFVINDADTNHNVAGTGFLNASIPNPELIAQADGSYELKINGSTNREVTSFSEGIIANLKVGTQVVFDLLVDNLTIRTKLISPIADIDRLKVIDATVSGTLFADNIKGKTIDALNTQLDLLNEKYSTASAILADLQTKYASYDSLLGHMSTATMSGDPLALSPLATTSANLPSDLALNSLTVHTIYSNDILANGSVLAQSFSSFDTDLFIQPTGDKPVHILANLMTLYPDGKVVVSGDLLVNGTIYSIALDTRTATVSGSLALGRGELATDSGKLMALFDSTGQIVGSVDASGSANFGQLTTDGLVIASGNANSTATVSAEANSNATIGVATIATGSAEISVVNNKVKNSTLIYITPISNTANQVLYVKSKEAGVGFTVAVPTNPINVTQEISFNYWLVETK